MPWRPRYSEAEARAAISSSTSWAEVLDKLGYGYFGNNISTVRRWAAKWGISVAHLPHSPRRNTGHRNTRHRHTSAELAAAVAASRSWAETLRRLGYCNTGGNWKTLKRRVAELGISTAHFDPYAATRAALRSAAIPLEEVLVRESTYSRTRSSAVSSNRELKSRRCETCGQGELWRGKQMGLILDHINGVRDDNRLENLRIVCPNCAATLETHCGRKNTRTAAVRDCLLCTKSFAPKYPGQRYCSRECGSRWDRRGVKRPGARRSDVRRGSSSRWRSKRLATAPWAASTAFRTTRYEVAARVRAGAARRCGPTRRQRADPDAHVAESAPRPRR